MSRAVDRIAQSKVSEFCESGCPERPEATFDSEDTQLVSLVLEAEDMGSAEAEANVIENNTVGSGAAGGALGTAAGIVVMNIFVGMTAASLF